MKKNVLACLAILITSMMNAGDATGDTSLRCGNALIDIGDTMYEVRLACGEPLSEQRVGERTTYRILEDQSLKIKDNVYLTEWIFKKDSGTYVLTFEGSRLTDKRFIR